MTDTSGPQRGWRWRLVGLGIAGVAIGAWAPPLLSSSIGMGWVTGIKVAVIVISGSIAILKSADGNDGVSGPDVTSSNWWRLALVIAVGFTTGLALSDELLEVLPIQV